MRYKVDHDYHIHSFLSTCSNDPLQTRESILQYAKDKGLERICITDHYWDSSVPGASGWYQPQNFDHISRSKPLPQADDIEFMFGCETDMDRFMTIGCPESRYNDFSFIIIPTTHLHMTGFTISEEDASDMGRRAKLWVDRMDALLDRSLPFHKIGIAHLATCLINWRNQSREEYFATLNMIPSDEIERVFTKAAERGCGIELNGADMCIAGKDTEAYLRPFHIAKSCGCKFYLGSDAHTTRECNRYFEGFERSIDLLGLEEKDKFHIGA